MIGNLRARLQRASAQIALKYGKERTRPLKAFSKLFFAPRWAALGVREKFPHAWKRGELVEVLEALVKRDRYAFQEEMGDVGYYVAQTWDWLWWLYTAVVPRYWICLACSKFDRRAGLLPLWAEEEEK